MLLKNDKKLLPLKANQYKKIAVIGPNANYTMTSGGGSARLLSSYTVSPLQGIAYAAEEIGALVQYTIGATSHLFLPLLTPYVHQGAKLEFWNESPAADYLNLEPNFSTPLKEAIWDTHASTTDCCLLDGVVSSSRYSEMYQLTLHTGRTESPFEVLVASKFT